LIRENARCSLTQRIEAFGHLAELLDERAIAGSYSFRVLMGRLACQCRALTAQARRVDEETAAGLAGNAWSASSALDPQFPIYLFYPRDDHGSASTFEAHHCTDDDAALASARQALSEHSSAVEIEVWLGDRLVGCHNRASPA